MELGGGLEENILAFVDSFNEKGISEANEDGISFIEAVRSSSLVSENGTRPTKKMYEAIFCLMKQGRSLELMMASFMLLKELDKFFNADGSSDTSGNIEDWCPFILNVHNGEKKTANGHPDGIRDSLGFSILLQKIADLSKGTDMVKANIKLLGDLVLLHYLINVIERDFQCRLSKFNETLKWTFLRESFLSTLMASRKISFKALIKDCLSILCYISNKFSQSIFHPQDSPPASSENSNYSLILALLELVTHTPFAIQTLLVMIMELDVAKKTADMSGQTNRTDGIRSQLLDIILDEFTYNKDILARFLKVFNEPKWKLEIVLQYFSKYNSKPSLRSKKPNGCHTDELTTAEFLKYFSGTVNTRNIVKKMGSEEVQLLITHTFKAYMSLSLKKNTAYNITPQMCNDLISAFQSLRKINRQEEILPIGMETIFMAATALKKVGEVKGV